MVMLIFAGGGIVSLYQGVSRCLHPRLLDHLGWTYTILVIPGLAEGCSFAVAYREFRSNAGNDEDLLPAIHGSKDPSTFAILFEDGAALAGLVIAFAGLLLAQILQKPFPDAIASWRCFDSDDRRGSWVTKRGACWSLASVLRSDADSSTIIHEGTARELHW